MPPLTAERLILAPPDPSVPLIWRRLLISPLMVIGKSTEMPPLAVRASSSPENPFGTASATPPLTVFNSNPGPSHFSFGQVGAYTAIHGLASDVAVHVAEHNAAVHGMRIDAATDVFNDDAAVCGIRANVSLARHLQLYATDQ